jgi:integrase
MLDSHVNRYLRTAVTNATLTDAWAQRLSIGVTRHTHATWLLAMGVPLPAVQKRLGHARGSRITLETYAHVIEEFDTTDPPSCRPLVRHLPC